MAVGKNSLKFIAWCARSGCNDEHIREMYDWVLHCGGLSSSKIETWCRLLDLWVETKDRSIYWNWWHDYTSSESGKGEMSGE